VTDALVLVVEDDDAIARGLCAALEHEGYAARFVATAADALTAMGPDRVSLVLLDLGLPDGDGVDLCRDLRRSGHTMPIVMLTARQHEVDVVVGLDAGANDYIVKPFRLAELLARVRAHLRTTSPTTNGDDVQLELAARRVFIRGDEIELRPKEFDLLALLVSHPGQVMTREHIMEAVWDEHWFGSTKTLDMHISALRKKLGDASEHIVTLRHVGYRFDP
jgi:DNA-binding response OmpR family regulator